MEIDMNASLYLLNSSNDENVSEFQSLQPSSVGYNSYWYESGRIQIPLYGIIFMLAITGNCLVILTLVSEIIIFKNYINCRKVQLTLNSKCLINALLDILLSFPLMWSFII